MRKEARVGRGNFVERTTYVVPMNSMIHCTKSVHKAFTPSIMVVSTMETIKSVHKAFTSSIKVVSTMETTKSVHIAFIPFIMVVSTMETLTKGSFRNSQLRCCPLPTAAMGNDPLFRGSTMIILMFT